MSTKTLTQENLKTLITNEELINKIKETADKINESYPNDVPLNVVCVLKGAVMFFSALVQYLKMPLKFEFVQLSSYGSNTTSSGEIKQINFNLPSFENENVLIIEDILDTGLTLDFLTRFILEKCKAKSVKLAVLFNKKCKRKYDIDADFSAFEVDDKFIVGFGLDYNENFRNLNYIGYFE